MGVGVTTGVGDTVGIGVAVGKGVGLAMTVGVTIGVGCSPALSLEVSFVTGKRTLILSGLSVDGAIEVDGGGVDIGVAGAITGEAIGVAVIISGCAFVATFLMPVPFPTFATSGTLLEKRKYQ